MNREEAMECVSYGCSDMEIKKEFYDGLVEEYFSGGGLLEEADDKSQFFKIDGQLADAVFSCIEEEIGVNRCMRKYRIAGTGAYVELSWRYSKGILSRGGVGYRNFLFLSIHLDQFNGEDDPVDRGFYVEERREDVAARCASFVRGIPQWEEEWERFDIAGVRREVEQRKSAIRAKCAAIEVPVRDFVRHIGLPYDITKWDDGYDVFFRISGGMYLKASFTADNYSEEKLRELEKLAKQVDASCRSLNGWCFRMRTEEENEEDYVTDDAYSWHEPE